jgi:hypothetical protein
MNSNIYDLVLDTMMENNSATEYTIYGLASPQCDHDCFEMVNWDLCDVSYQEISASEMCEPESLDNESCEGTTLIPFASIEV